MTVSAKHILIEGYTADQILAFTNAELDRFIFVGEPIVFCVGSAEILGQFERTKDTLVLELAQIDRGGEGVLPALGALAARFAKREGLGFLEWRVHAINCAKPNLKLRRFLEKRGFEIKQIAKSGECYHRIEALKKLTAY